MRQIKLLTAFLAIVLTTLQSVSAQTARHPLPEDSLDFLQRPAPGFRLKDPEGHTIELAALKGKVVILDFWATWCIPCHESFPGMQQAVNHYKNDTTVIFLFIDTREQSEDPVPLVKKDLARHHYSFHVLLDEKENGGEQKKVYNRYGMAGVPTKFIIDAKGLIRYKLEGYASWMTAEESAGEVERLIEKVRQF